MDDLGPNKTLTLNTLFEPVPVFHEKVFSNEI